MNAVINATAELDQDTLEETLTRYDVGALVRYWPAPNGIENSNYFIRTLAGELKREFVLTILEQPSNSGPAYVPLLDACRDAGLPVAPVLRNRAGSAFDSLNGKPTLLTPRLLGRHVYNPTVKQVQALGRFIARFHLATEDAPLEAPEYPRDIEWLTERAQVVKGFIGYSDECLIRDTVQRLASMFTRHDVASLPKGVIHGDLFRDNVLFDERGLTGVLDFHHAARGFLLYDLAVAANDWCNDVGGVLDPERTTALFAAYHRIRPLTQQELWFFPVFALYAAVAFWLSRLSVALQAANAASIRFKNPDEFKRIVTNHTSHAFYLDERILEVGQ